MNENLVSIIIPTFNRSSIIEKTIVSCFEQTYPFIEIIVIDDGSIDETKETVCSISNKYSNKNKFLNYYFQNNKGACIARNYGMKVSQGGYIQFLDSDDILHREKIAYQISKIYNNDFPCAICDFEYVDGGGNVYKKVLNDGNIFEYIKNFRSVSIMTPLIKKKSLINNMSWNPLLHRNQDMDFMYKYFLTIKKWKYTPGFYCKYVHHGDFQISDTYSLGVQYFELIMSFQFFYFKNFKNIPLHNLPIIGAYTIKLIKFYLRSRIKKLFPEVILEKLRYFFCIKKM